MPSHKDNKKYIIIKNAKTNNLKNIDIEIQRNKFIVITGLSGSGKSSLAFDTLYAEGQRRYIESLSSYARQFLGQMEKPKLIISKVFLRQFRSNRKQQATIQDQLSALLRKFMIIFVFSLRESELNIVTNAESRSPPKLSIKW